MAPSWSAAVARSSPMRSAWSAEDSSSRDILPALAVDCVSNVVARRARFVGVVSSVWILLALSVAWVSTEDRRCPCSTEVRSSPVTLLPCLPCVASRLLNFVACPACTTSAVETRAPKSPTTAARLE
ncbi:hypothetical protein G6F59_016465 [Rhizopus arrhizus]|nr:hypothetical protein G6F59_016465 [Rhizopus arrhizus]